MSINKNGKSWVGPSNSEQYLQNKHSAPAVNSAMAQSVSQFRRDGLATEVEQGLYRDGSSPVSKESSSTQNSNVVASVGIKKVGQVVGGGGYRGGNGESVKQTPEVYSPLWLNSNLNLPRDRATINAWCRSFYALNPFVHNAINLHSTYPISKLNIKCPNKEIEKFFNDMVEEIDLMNICVQIAQEFWLLGEAFIYAELDEGKGKWNRLLIQNPDYMVVKRTVVANEPIIMLRPDENLKKIVFSNKPSDVEQRKQLDDHIVDSVKRGDNITIDNFRISHLARRISPYEIRGTGLPVCVFRQLMLFDKLRECYDEETEVLTDLGFKKISQLLDLTKEVKSRVKNIKVACVDPATNKVFYKTPNKVELVDYSGKLYSFNGKKVDLSVLPSSFLWAKEKTNNVWSDYKKIPAQQLINNKKNYKFNCKVDFDNQTSLNTVDVCGYQVPTKLYLKVLGYLISEGCIYSNFENNRYDAFISVSQLTSSDCFVDMKQSFDEFAKVINKKSNNYIKSKGNGYSENTPKEMWNTSIHGKDIVKFFTDEIGDNGNTKSNVKRIPRWALNLNKELSEVLLNALVKGDGTEGISKFGTGSKNFKYSTISKQLADDVYELVYKCGYVPNLCISTAKKTDDRTVTEYIVMWSDTVYGNEPNVFTIEKTGNNGGGAHCSTTNYQGKLWNIDLNELMITRKNGKVSVQYVNCYDNQVEILTEFGFKKFDELLESSINPNYVNGVAIDNNEVSSVVSIKEDFKIACVNPTTNTIEYHKPVELHMSHYQGEMIHFQSKNIDSLVSPNHKMWAQKKHRINGINSWSNFEKVKAQDISPKTTYRFEAVSNWEGQDIKSVDVLGKQVPVELYLKFLGYVVSEGYLGQNYIDFTQKVDSDCINDIKNTVTQFASIFNLPLYEREVTTKDYKKFGFKKQPSNRWNARINSKDLMNYFISEIGESKSTSAYKKIPTWVKSLNKGLLSTLLETLVLGDGSHLKNKKSLAWKYYTISRQLADDVQEIAFKCGFAPSISTKALKSGNVEYCVSWSNAENGKHPVLSPNNKYPSKINKEDYNGVVWCFEVPTGLFITRRNGKIAIHGNSKYAQADNMINPLTLVKIGSADFKPTFADLEAWRNIFEEAQYDKDFKVFTHEGVTVERVGYGSGLVDIGNDITQLIKEIYVGLQVPSVLMDGGGDTTYANGGVALDVLRQRYMQFRNMMSAWLRRKIFAPISKIQGFYEYNNGEKQLIVPEVDWNHMSLFDAGDYIQNLVNLTQGETEQRRASLHTLYRSLGLEFSDEMRKLKKEAIQSEIAKKEKAALATLDLNALRALSEEDEIPEPKKDGAEGAPEGGAPPLPGEAPPGGEGMPPPPPPPM